MPESTDTTDITDGTETDPGWLSTDELGIMRGRVPLVYVDALPVRVDSFGDVTHVGLLLRVMPDGTISRALGDC